MVIGTIWELLVLWIILCIVGSGLGAAKIIIPLNIFIVAMIIAGFFMGIGIHIFNLLI